MGLDAYDLVCASVGDQRCTGSVKHGVVRTVAAPVKVTGLKQQICRPQRYQGLVEKFFGLHSTTPSALMLISSRGLE